MQEYTTDRAEEIRSGWFLSPVEFWCYVSGILFLNFAVTTYVNSRHANPACVGFEAQNKLIVAYEKGECIGSLKRVMSYKFKNSESAIEKRETLVDYLALKKGLGEK